LKPKKSALIALVVITFLSLIILCPVNVPVGSKTFRKSLTSLNGDRSLWPDVFNQTGWDGPTGSRTSGEIYAVRIGDWLLRFDIVTANPPMYR
jgi:hypothetical protein